MYIINNAFKSIIRNKSRNILIGVIIFVIATASCISLSIRQAAETAKADTLSSLSISAQISYDRSAAMADMQASGTGGKSSFDSSRFQGTALTLDDYMTYVAAQNDGDSYYYSLTTSLNATGDLAPYTTSTQSTTTPTESIRGGKNIVQGDFSLTGYSSYDAMISLFGEGGTYSISEGQMFDSESTDLNCVISDELAIFNELTIGNTITLSNPNNISETYTFNIVGIYTNSASSSGSDTFSLSDPANNIYMNYNALNSIITASDSVATTTTDENSITTSTALKKQLNFTYTFANADNYYSFADEVYVLGLSSDYIVSSADISAYENSLTPLKTLSTMAGWFFLVILIVGGVILIVLNIFNLRERKYEVGVLTAIGMKKYKVALQFICELFAITLIAITLGTSVGAATSIPVTNTLLANQIESAETSANTVNQNFGFSKGDTTSRVHSTTVSYVDSISSATNFTVILQLAIVGIVLTIISSLAALITIMRYEPLKILSSRS